MNYYKCFPYAEAEYPYDPSVGDSYNPSCSKCRYCAIWAEEEKYVDFCEITNEEIDDINTYQCHNFKKK